MFNSTVLARNSSAKTPHLKRIASVVAVTCLIASIGCSSGNHPQLGYVSGKVTSGGKPVADVLVRFTPQEGRPSAGYSNDRGEFVLQYNRGIDGAILGKHTVQLEVPVESPKSQNPNAVPKDPKIVRWPEQIEVTSDQGPVLLELEQSKE